MPSAAATFVLILLQIILVCPPALAEGAPRVRLPLQGYFHAGRSMPVLIELTDDSGPLRLSGPNIVPVEVPPRWSGVVPVLILTEAAEQSLTVELSGGKIEHFPLHPLTADQRLIATTYHGAPLPHELFESHSPVAVSVTAADLQNAVTIPNNTLDAIVTEQQDLKSIPQILAAGISVIVPGTQPTNTSVAWKEVSGYSILQAPTFGPVSAIGGDAAYLPTQSWAPGATVRLRHWIVLIAILISLLICLSLLLRRALFQVIGIAALTLISCVLIRLCFGRGDSVSSISGNIVVRSGGMMQFDRWEFVAAGSAGGETIAEAMRPILFDVDHAEKIGLKVVGQTGGLFAWSFALPPNGKLALLSRSILFANSSPKVDHSLSSPLYELARQSYLQAGMEIRGYAPTPGAEWGTIVVGPD